MAILPESLINKIMTYVSHPVADLFKKHVSILPGVIEKDPDVILIGIHDGNHMYEDHQWFSKEYECRHYSYKIEKQIVFNKLKSIMTELMTYDTLNCSLYKKLCYMYRNLDPTFKRLNKRILISFELHPDPFFKLFTDNEEDYSDCWGEFHFCNNGDYDYTEE